MVITMDTHDYLDKLDKKIDKLIQLLEKNEEPKRLVNRLEFRYDYIEFFDNFSINNITKYKYDINNTLNLSLTFDKYDFNNEVTIIIRDNFNTAFLIPYTIQYFINRDYHIKQSAYLANDIILTK